MQRRDSSSLWIGNENYTILAATTSAEYGGLRDGVWKHCSCSVDLD